MDNNPRHPETVDGFDEDDFDDDEEEGHSGSAAHGRKSGILKRQGSLISPDAIGLVRYYFHEAIELLAHPMAFFETMPTKGGLIEPIVFLALSASIYGLISAIGHLNPIVFFASFFSSAIYVTIGAFVASVIFTMAFGGRGNFESTFRVLAYSKVTLLFAWVAVGSMQVGGWAAIAYTVVMNIIGLTKVHKLPMHVVTGVVAVLAILQLVIKNLIKF